MVRPGLESLMLTPEYKKPGSADAERPICFAIRWKSPANPPGKLFVVSPGVSPMDTNILVIRVIKK
jgi:hypothetical protein